MNDPVDRLAHEMRPNSGIIGEVTSFCDGCKELKPVKKARTASTKLGWLVPGVPP